MRELGLSGARRGKRNRIPIPDPQAARTTGLVERRFDSLNSGAVPTDLVFYRRDLVTHYSD